MSNWQDHHLITDEEEKTQHVAHLEQVRHAREVVIPVFGQVHSMTLHFGEGTSVSLGQIREDPEHRTYYLHTTYTHPDKRGQGRLRTAMDEVYRLCAEWNWVLVTHPADPWLRSRLEKNGWTPHHNEAWATDIGGEQVPLYIKAPTINQYRKAGALG